MVSERYAALFRSEALDQIATLNRLLLGWERQPKDDGPLEPCFRAVHTLKGMFSAMGYDAAGRQAHDLETVLAALRGCAPDAVVDALPRLFRGVDELDRALHAAQPVAAAPCAPPTGGTALLVSLEVANAEPLPGARAFLALRRARELGEVSDVVPPEPALLEPGYDGRLQFSIIGDCCAEQLAVELRAIGGLEVLHCGPREGVAASQTAVSPEAAQATFIRVDADRLDGLLERAGELLILRDRLQRLSGSGDGEQVGQAVEQLSRMLSDLHHDVLQVRMVPVWQIAHRFPRLVRDAAKRSGKEVDFAVVGSDIELDRGVLEQVTELLVHLLRNAVDHGIEPPEERRRAGKAAAGALRLLLSRDGAQVVVRVQDDGRGIDRAAVANAGAAAGDPVAGDGSVTDAQLLRVIAAPGFSTAERLTQVSGRGVGLHVVVDRIRALGGNVRVETELGAGTTFTLRLPLTMALFQALVVRVEAHRFALPLRQISATMEVTEADLVDIGGRRYLQRSGGLVPVVHLAEVIGEKSAVRRASTTAVLLSAEEGIVALAVDELLGRNEVVSKHFDAPAGLADLFSGATVMSDGRPSLILDGGAVARHVAAHFGLGASTTLAAA